MVLLESFWTPFFWYETVTSAIVPIAVYTAAASALFITYTVYVMTGGESSQYYMPYFEADIHLTIYVWGGIAIAFFLFFIFSSYLLVRAVRVEIRGWMLPWMICMIILVFYKLYLGFHWLYDYYIYLENIFAMIILWFWMSYNIYVLLAVYSVYQIIAERQAPTMMILPEAYTENTLFYWDENV
ncbi:unnamed protein product [Orchesella dallaii]|uniref:Uncharacterized protein n=1 Tax=Orchesella dallaii TaxID=48710 RepID=A0ABP1RM74_9HEXA